MNSANHDVQKVLFLAGQGSTPPNDYIFFTIVWIFLQCLANNSTDFNSIFNSNITKIIYIRWNLTLLMRFLWAGIVYTHFLCLTSQIFAVLSSLPVAIWYLVKKYSIYFVSLLETEVCTICTIALCFQVTKYIASFLSVSFWTWCNHHKSVFLLYLWMRFRQSDTNSYITHAMLLFISR